MRRSGTVWRSVRRGFGHQRSLRRPGIRGSRPGFSLLGSDGLRSSEHRQDCLCHACKIICAAGNGVRYMGRIQMRLRMVLMMGAVLAFVCGAAMGAEEAPL